MNRLWTYIDEKEWSERTKYSVTLCILALLFAAVGLILWLLIRNRAFSSWDCMLCFVGYPIILAWFVLVFYSCRHSYK